MSLQERVKKKSKSMELFATAGTIGMHMVSGPIVGFGIGYGLDAWLGTSPWMKLVFFLVGIGAGFLNVHRDSQHLLRKMQREKEAEQAARRGAESVAEAEKNVHMGGTEEKVATAAKEDKSDASLHSLKVHTEQTVSEAMHQEEKHAR